MGFCRPSTMYCKSTRVPTDEREAESVHRYPVGEGVYFVGGNKEQVTRQKTTSKSAVILCELHTW